MLDFQSDHAMQSILPPRIAAKGIAISQKYFQLSRINVLQALLACVDDFPLLEDPPFRISIFKITIAVLQCHSI
jgi:hypothetical protein